MAGFIGEAHDFVFDGRAIARAVGVFDDASVHGRLVDVGADDVVGAFVSAGNVAVDLTRVVAGTAKVGKDGHGGIAGLDFHAAVIDGARIKARRGAGFHTREVEWQVMQAGGEFVRGRVAGTATGETVQADMDFAAEKGAGGEDGRFGAVVNLLLGAHTAYAPVLNDEVGNSRLEDVEVGLVLHHFAHGAFVEVAVGLGAGGAHGGAFATVQDTPLDAGAIGSSCHDAA